MVDEPPVAENGAPADGAVENGDSEIGPYSQLGRGITAAGSGGLASDPFVPASPAATSASVVLLLLGGLLLRPAPARRRSRARAARRRWPRRPWSSDLGAGAVEGTSGG